MRGSESHCGFSKDLSHTDQYSIEHLQEEPCPRLSVTNRVTGLTFSQYSFHSTLAPDSISVSVLHRVCNGRTGFGNGVGNVIKLPHGHMSLFFFLCTQRI